MTGAIGERIDALDAKQAIFQAKRLVQAATDGTKRVETISDEEIAGELKTLGAGEAATLMGAAEAMPTGQAGAAAKTLLHLFATTPGGENILAAALQTKDESADFGFITGPLLATFLWLTIAGDFDLKFGGFHYVKKGLTPAQQAKLLKEGVPTAVKALVKSVFGTANT